jgi:hypothetical protein
MSFWKVFASSLGLTVSNIATLFLYIALFARFNVIDADKPFGYDLLTISFIGSELCCGGYWSLTLSINCVPDSIREGFRYLIRS